MFDADRPILSGTEDRLSRAVFAKYLARCMLDRADQQSLVIGLNGGWGSGKTSIINLIIEELRNAANSMLEEQQPIILNFSAWSYSGQQQLIYSFFRRLSSELRQVPNLQHSQDILNLLELYASYFTQKPVPKILEEPKNKSKKNSAEPAYAWESGKDPIQVKQALNKLLAAQNRKIIIIMDNISRLLPKEIAEVMQIVKSMADYDNTIYLLSFDKKQMIQSFNQIYPDEGEAYIAKLVQLPFEVPPISQQDLDNLLLDKLQHLIPLIPEDSWDNAYWFDIYSRALKHFFHSTRDITTYVNTLAFSYPRVKEVVNPVDFFILTAIEVFEPDVYYGIRDNKDLFTDLLQNVYQLDAAQASKESSRCDDIINRTRTIPAALIKEVLMHLFPRVRKLYYPEMKFYHSDILSRKNRRICSPDVFDVYFRLSMSSGEITQSELQMLWAQTANEELFSQSLLRLNQDGKILKLLDWLDGNIANIIPSKNIPNIISALIDASDLFPEGEKSLMQFPTPTRVHRICRQLLGVVRGTDERFQYLQKAFEHANKSLYSIVNEVALQTKQHLEFEEEYLPAEHRDLTLDQLQALQKHAVNKIKFWARIGRLAEHPKLLPILQAWRAWGDEDECLLFIDQLIREQRGLISFLRATLANPIRQAMTKLQKTPDWYDALDNITFFLPVNVVTPFAIRLFEGDEFEILKEEEQLALLIFLDLADAKTVKTIPKTSG